MALAVWRVSNMLVWEYGPFGLFLGIRSMFGIRHTQDGQPMSFSHRNILNCVWCVSVWVGTAFVITWLWFPTIVFWVSLVLTFSAIACVLDYIKHLAMKAMS
jgi:hypothetical protein